MNRSIKGVLLSALIFPGFGQIALGYKKRGWTIFVAHIILLYLIISEIMQKAYSIIDEMKKSGAVFDVEIISNKAAALSEFSDNTFLNIVLVLFIFGWFITIIDAYQLGKK